MIENLIVALIVLTACVLTVRSFLKSIRSGKCSSCKNCAFDRHGSEDPESETHCGCGCGGHGKMSSLDSCCGHGSCGHGGCGHDEPRENHSCCGHGSYGCRKD